MTHSSDRFSSNPSTSTRRLGAGLLTLILAAAPIQASAADGPVAPCGAGGPAPLPAFGNPPNARNWHPSDIPAAWSPPPCMAWAAERFTVLTALAGSFKFEGTADDLLVRFGAMSAWRGIQYWSITDMRWDTLIADASALDGSSPGRRRADFTLLELKSGADLYFLQQDNRSSDAVIYRMTVEVHEPNRLIVTVENVSSVSMFIFTIFDVGDLKSTYIFQQRSPASWGYYNLSGAREGAALIGNHDSSYLNRALAIYRHLAGIPGNQEPPLAR